MTAPHSLMSPELRAAALELLTTSERARMTRQHLQQLRADGRAMPAVYAQDVWPRAMKADQRMEGALQRAEQDLAVALARDEQPATAQVSPWRFAAAGAAAGFASGITTGAMLVWLGFQCARAL